MESVLDCTNDLIDTLDNTDFINNMKETKKSINDNNLINTDDVKSLYSNPVIHKYVENQNILDLHILYLNQRLKEITKNKICE